MPTLTSSTYVSSTSSPSSMQAMGSVLSDTDRQSAAEDKSDRPQNSKTSDHPHVASDSEQGVEEFNGALDMFRRALQRTRRIGGEYTIVRRIDEGSYGVVYKVMDTSGRFYAAKIAKSPTFGSSLHTEQTLLPPAVRVKMEGQVYAYYKGRHVGCRVVVMDLLGRSVKKQFIRYGPLSTQSILLFGIQATSRIEELHKRGYVHRDVKPSNFAVGLKEDSGTIYLIDLGMAERFRSTRSRKHVKKRTGYSLLGSKDFASRASHRGETQSRRADLESIVYTMVFLREGRLKWTLHSTEAAAKMKEEISPSHLCGKLPREVAEYFRLVRNLDFEERPNYAKLRDILVRGMQQRGLDIHGKFDWER